MKPTPAPEELPPSLRFLKLLVTVLTATLILGVITIIGLLVTRLPGRVEPPAIPATLHLPQGAVPAAVTQGKGWVAVVTEDDRILIFNHEGRMTQEVRVER